MGSIGTPYLTALQKLSTPEGMVPEQVWNNSVGATTHNWAITTPVAYTAGTATKSISPLSWAMGEYINLRASIANNKIADMPQVVCGRYANCLMDMSLTQSRVKFNVKATTSPGQYMYVAGNTAELGAWDTDLAIPVDPRNYTVANPAWFNNVNMTAGTAVEYKYFRKNSDGSVTWENFAGNRNFVMPAAPLQTTTRTDTVVW